MSSQTAKVSQDGGLTKPGFGFRALLDDLSQCGNYSRAHRLGQGPSGLRAVPSLTKVAFLNRINQ